MIHDRLKEACQHPDNHLGMATLMAGLVIEDPVEARDYFISRVIPAALAGGYYRPITINDPACGSSILLLGAATRFPDWANQLGLVQYYGQDIDEQCVRMSKINLMLYGLNGFGCNLTHNFAVSARVCFQ